MRKVDVGTQTVKPVLASDAAELYLPRYVVLDLREMRRARGLPVGGLKDDLVRRIVLSPERAVCRTSCTRAMAEMGPRRKADHRILHDKLAMSAWIDSATVE